MRSSLVTCVVSVWLETTLDPPPDRHHKLIFVNLYRTHFCGRCHMYFAKSFAVVTSNLYLAYFVSGRGLCMLYCARRTEVIITRISFHPITLCLNMPKINSSGVRLPKFEPTPATWSC